MIDSRECSGYLYIYINIKHSHTLWIPRVSMICILFKTLQTVFVQKMYQSRFSCDCIWFSPGYEFFSHFYIMSFLNIFTVCFMSLLLPSDQRFCSREYWLLSVDFLKYSLFYCQSRYTVGVIFVLSRSIYKTVPYYICVVPHSCNRQAFGYVQ